MFKTWQDTYSSTFPLHIRLDSHTVDALVLFYVATMTAASPAVEFGEYLPQNSLEMQIVVPDMIAS